MNGGKVTRKEIDKVWKHIETTNHELGQVCKTQQKISTDVDWLKRFQWLIFTAAISSVIITIFRAMTGC